MKRSLRQSALAYRNQLQLDESHALSQDISISVSTLLQTFQPCTVGLFYPTRGEPNVLGIMNNLALNAFLWALPVCCESPTEHFLQFAQFAPDLELEVGRYDIPVPKSKSWVQPSVLIVPCLAFHRKGARLGYGAGWYDRTLSQMSHKPLVVGVAYASTESTYDFSEKHDVLLDYIATERELISTRSGCSQ
ncbi:5-formyltetrahydrofolate cyclo-ligase [uncultured Limnobacter sp.]|uniref:5-formyltetrahydrofolate cyclo-ligase n=1 Tax=uncultured Limnobacter sp. TaxID=199681 RepID=UPI0030F9B356